jgi:ATP-dependent DNA helicase
MMEKQVSKKKLERMTIVGGDFRKAGRRSRGEISFDQLNQLLQSEIKDLTTKGGDVEDIKIDEDEFEMIMDRKKLFTKGPGSVPTEGKMYDIIEPEGGEILGSMEA